MLERDVEKELNKWVVSMGGLSIKLTAPPVGIPDRLVVFPKGLVYFIELKRDKGKTSAIQNLVISKLKSLELNVVVLYGLKGLEQFKKDYLNEYQASTS